MAEQDLPSPEGSADNAPKQFLHGVSQRLSLLKDIAPGRWLHVRRSEDATTIDLAIGEQDMESAPHNLRWLFAQMGVLDRKVGIVSLSLRNAGSGVKSIYGFTLELKPALQHPIEAVRKGAHAFTVFAGDGIAEVGNEVLKVYTTLDKIHRSKTMLGRRVQGRIFESEAVAVFMHETVDWLNGVLQSRRLGKP